MLIVGIGKVSSCILIIIIKNRVYIKIKNMVSRKMTLQGNHGYCNFYGMLMLHQ